MGRLFCVAILGLLCSVALADVFKGYSYYRGNNTSPTGLVTEGKTLTLNGKPLQILSGALHYFRVHPDYWEDRLIKFKAAGLNAVETYVPWNLHQPTEADDFKFTHWLDVRKFVETAKKLDLLVIFRPGPFICAEWEFGGLPSWLLKIDGLKIRTTQPAYMDRLKEFYNAVIEQISDLQFTQHGPVFLVQVENEYGAYGSDTEFLDASKQLLIDAGVTETFVTSDSPRPNELTDGAATNVWFAVNEKDDMDIAVEKLATLQPNKPLMVMEYWAGWFNHWGEEHVKVSTEKFALELRYILDRNASVNFYVFHGGSSFGFMNGANFALTNLSLHYEPDITSYDYDAPVSESGQLREKWHKTKEILKEYGLLPDESELPKVPEGPHPKAYGELKISKWMAFEDLKKSEKVFVLSEPINMEKLDQSYGFISYSRKIPNKACELVLPELHDRAIVYVDGQQVRVIEYTEATSYPHKIPISKTRNGDEMDLTVLVENMGRVNYARKDSIYNDSLNHQWKGMKGVVTFCDEQLDDWIAHLLDFDEEYLSGLSDSVSWKDANDKITYPALLQTTLEIDGNPQDTFVDVTGWGKGNVFVNGFNLGRYWPEKGPQQTLYLPGPLLKKGKNTIQIFELHKSTLKISLEDKHRLSPNNAASNKFFFALVLAAFLAVFKV